METLTETKQETTVQNQSLASTTTSEENHTDLGEMIYQDLVARGKKEYTAREWRSKTDRFVRIIGNKPTYDRNDVTKYLVAMRNIGHCQNTINKDLKPLHLLAQLQNWQFPKMSMKKVHKEDVTRTILSVEEIGQLILRGRQALPKNYQAFLALSTIYGLRREEMVQLTPEDIGKDGLLHVRVVAKGGSPTNHQIPDCIRPILKEFHPTDARYMTRIFRRICRACAIKIADLYGWHSIRRALVTQLVIKDQSALNIVRFMRWSEQGTMKGEFGMLALYAQRDQGNIDNAIFANHPFLKYWQQPV